METILLVVLIIVAISMIGVVLIQRSEGGALGIGSGGPGAMFSARGSANFLTRVTAVLAAIFIILSLVLAILSKDNDKRKSVMDAIPTSSSDDNVDILDDFDSEDYEPQPINELEVDKDD